MKISAKWAAGCAALLLSGVVSGCATTGPAAGPAAGGMKTYTCAGGKTVRVDGAAGEAQVRLTLPEGRDVKLSSVEGRKNVYGDATLTLTFEGAGVNVKFVSAREPLTGCVAAP